MLALRKITTDNFEECLRLTTKKKQQKYVEDNRYSLAQSYVFLSEQKILPLPYAIYQDEQMVGFVMLSYGHQEPNDLASPLVYIIWRFMIDEHYQHHGYGKMALQEIINYLKTFPYGPAQTVRLSYVPGNSVAKHLYYEFGFLPTGEIDEGEIVLALNLTAE